MVRRFIVCAAAALGLMTFSVSASAGDYVSSVQSCGNSVIIQLASGKTIVVLLADTTQDNYDHLYAMALELLASGKQTGYYNNAGTSNVCGYTNIQEITTLTATNKS